MKKTKIVSLFIAFATLLIIFYTVALPQISSLNSSKSLKENQSIYVMMISIPPFPAYNAKSIAVHEAYAQKHGYTFKVFDRLDSSRPPAWSKIKAMLQLIDEGCDWIWSIDLDTVVMNSNIRLETFIAKANGKQLIASKDWNGLNTGSFLLKCSDWTRQFLERVYTKYKLPMSHVWWEQAAIIDLLENDKQVASQFAIIDQRGLNSYSEGIGPKEGWWVKGDLIVHFPGLAKEEKEKKWFEYYHKSDYALCKQKVDGLRIVVLQISASPYPQYHELSIENHQRYARLHGYSYALFGRIDKTRHPAWSKVKAIQRVIKEGCDWIWSIDLDTVITNSKVSLQSFIAETSDKEFILSRDWNGINTGSMLVKCSDWMYNFFERVYLLDKLPLSDLWWEQAGMIELYEKDAEVKAKMVFVVQRKLNSYVGGLGPEEGWWQEGDFVVHFPGIPSGDKARRWFEYHKKSDEYVELLALNQTR